MSTEPQIEKIESLIAEMLSAETAYFLVNIRIKPTNNVKVFIDGDNGLAIDKCVQFNRKLYKLIEETGMYPEGEYSLEVSSPGIDEPLKLHRQYQKNKGRIIEVVFEDATKKEGTLLEVTETDLLLEYTEGKGKKAQTHQVLIPFTNIKTTTVQIKF
jgi:ribosome maturation factor RimP